MMKEIKVAHLSVTFNTWKKKVAYNLNGAETNVHLDFRV